MTPSSRTGLRRSPKTTWMRVARAFATSLFFVLIATACGSDTTDDAVGGIDEPETDTTEESAGATEPEVTVRDSGITVTVQQADELVLHSLTASEEVFANSSHIIETNSSLVVVDTQFLLPNALDVRAYADELGKPIDRVFITHEHPDHFLGSEAFADVPVYALEAVSASIAASGDAEVEEKQADFGDAIAGSYVVPEVVGVGTIEIDGVNFELTEVLDAEAEVQLVIRVPEAGAIVTGDLVYSGVHLILAGPADTWTTAIEGLAADAESYPIVLPGHGLPSDPSVYDTNIDWLATATELMGTAETADEFKQGLVDAYPNLGMAAAIDFVTPFLFPADTEATEVTFGDCAEVSTGTVAPLAALQAGLPEGVTALSLTAQGTEFDGSDDLGVLITRTLRCDGIAVGDDAATGEKHIAHVGTPVDAGALPASPYNNDGGNGADFNNYIFGYYSDSATYIDALTAAGVTGAETATITMTDTEVDSCVVSRSVTVSAAAFSFDVTGDMPDASCEDPVVPFIANWWSVTDGGAAVASNNIAGQAAVFIDPSATIINVTATGDGLAQILGDAPVLADAFGVIGLIPGSDGPSMTVTAAGPLPG